MNSDKITFLINSLDMGGAERVVVSLLNNFVDKYDCYLILMENKVCYDLDNRIKVIHLNENPLSSGLMKLIRLPIIAFNMSKIIKEHKFSKVLSFLSRSNYVNVLSHFLTKHDVLISEHSLPSKQYSNNSIQSRINKFLIKKLYNHSDRIIAVSKYVKYDLKINLSINVPIQTIYNPIDLDLIESQSKQNINMNTNVSKFIFVTVGRLDEGKNHKLLIDAIKDLDAHLWIIGDGALRKELEKYINKLNLNEKIYLLGIQSNPFKYLAKADCFVFGSNYESLGMVLLESLACGLPIISTNCMSGPREILAPKSDIFNYLHGDIEIAENGVLVPVENSEKMGFAMKMIMVDEELRNKLIEKSYKRAADFGVEKIIKQYEEILCAE